MEGCVLGLVHQPASPGSALVQGSAESLEAAKTKFKAAWEQFYASLTPELIKHRHNTEDRMPRD